jgi:hypothetical protein
MIGLGSMMKLARGGMDMDDLAEMFAAMGIEMTVEPISATVEAFKPLAVTASLPSSKIMELRGEMKDGGRIHALLVLSPKF